MFLEVWKNSNLRLYFVGRFISSIGNHFSFFAQSVAAYVFTGTLTAVGFLWLVRGLASVILIPIGGLIADRYRRKYTLLTTDILLSFVTLSFVFVNQSNHYWLLPLLAFVSQAIQRIYDPTAKASFKSVSSPTPLKIAGSVSALLGQLSIIIGPLIASLLFWLSDQSLAMLFILDALTFFISFLFILKVDMDGPQNNENQKKSILIDGIQFLSKQKEIRYLIFLLFPIAWSGKLFDVLVLELNRYLSNDSFYYLGLLLSIFATGGILGSVVVPKLYDFIDFNHLVKVSGLLLCGLLILVGKFFSIPIILLFSFLFGTVLTSTVTLLQIIIQEKVDDAYLGRVFAGWGLIAVIGGGMGAFIIGFMLDTISIDRALLLIGLITLIPFLFSTFRFPDRTHQRIEENFSQHPHM